MESLLHNIQQRIALSDELKRSIEDDFRLIKLNKNELFVREGQFVQDLFYLEKGTIRSYYYSQERDISSWFYSEDQFFTCWYSFSGQYSSFENLETLEESQIYAISRTKYESLMQRFSAFQEFGRLIAEEHLAFIDYYSKGYMFLSAKERYDLLLSFFPDIELRVKLGHIASFLGLSQETLSRIRKRK